MTVRALAAWQRAEAVPAGVRLAEAATRPEVVRPETAVPPVMLPAEAATRPEPVGPVVVRVLASLGPAPPAMALAAVLLEPAPP
jgi:hypothetical protein